MNRQDIIRQALEAMQSYMRDRGWTDHPLIKYADQAIAALSALQQGQAIKDKGEPVMCKGQDQCAREQARRVGMKLPVECTCAHPAKVEQGRVMTDEDIGRMSWAEYPIPEDCATERKHQLINYQHVYQKALRYARDHGYLAHPPEEAGVWIPGDIEEVRKAFNFIKDIALRDKLGESTAVLSARIRDMVKWANHGLEYLPYPPQHQGT